MNERAGVDSWVVLLDGEREGRYRTRARAREYARWLRRHPACRDRVRFGHGGDVRVMRASAWAWERGEERLEEYPDVD